MRKFLAAFAFAVVPLTGAASLSACASFEAVAPKSPRAALAEAEILFVGVLDVTSTLHARGLIEPAQMAALLQTYGNIAESLNAAHALLKAGDEIGSAQKVAGLVGTLNAISLQLSMVAESAAARPPVEPPPPSAPVPFPTSWEI